MITRLEVHCFFLYWPALCAWLLGEIRLINTINKWLVLLLLTPLVRGCRFTMIACTQCSTSNMPYFDIAPIPNGAFSSKSPFRNDFMYTKLEMDHKNKSPYIEYSCGFGSTNLRRRSTHWEDKFIQASRMPSQLLRTRQRKLATLSFSEIIGSRNAVDRL